MIQTDTGLLNLLPETVYINQVTNKISPKNCHIHNKENRFQIASINLALTDRLIVHHFISLLVLLLFTGSLVLLLFKKRKGGQLT